MNARNSVAGLRNSRLIIGLMVLLVSAIALFVTILVITNTESSHDKQYVRHVSELRILNENIANNTKLALSGQEDGFDNLTVDISRFSEHLGYITKGNQETGLPGNPELVRAELDSVQEVWDNLVLSVLNQILENKGVVLGLYDAEGILRNSLPKVQAAYSEAAEILVSNKGSSELVAIMLRQSLLAEKLLFSAGETIRGGSKGVAAEKTFKAVNMEFERINKALIEGDKSLGISRVTNAKALRVLKNIDSELQVISGASNTVENASSHMLSARNFSEIVLVASDKLLDQMLSLDKRFRGLSAERKVTPEMGYASGLLALLIVALLGVIIYRDTRKNLVAQYEANERSQGAILRLLDEIADLADGDLTTSVTVSEDFTGAIADSINYSIDQLRSLVVSVNKNSVLVSSAAEETQGTATRLAEASISQAEEISQATSSINTIAKSMDDVSERAGDSSKAAEYSVIIANKGADAVQNTIHGMDKIREQIQKTSKQIKRLGESSQEIGDIVSLINDIADQTNILSLNAAIQASMAGEAGRGFAVVADEVQRLAERSGAATKQIEVLVKTIQADTNDAVISMEQTTAEVVQGARLAQDAGVALGEIEKVSDELSNLIKDISAAAQGQSAAANQVSGTMNVIQEITNQTSSGVTATASSIGNLAEMAKDMRSTVAGFTLPEDELSATLAVNDDVSANENELLMRAEEMFGKEETSIAEEDVQETTDSIDGSESDVEVELSDELEVDIGLESNSEAEESKAEDDNNRNISAA